MTKKLDTGGPLISQSIIDPNHTPISSFDFPRFVTTLSEKTWLDECAMRAMQAILGNTVFMEMIANSEGVHTLAETAYNHAKDMLAEKRRLESESE